MVTSSRNRIVLVLSIYTYMVLSSPNRIVLENQLPGSPSTEWDVNGAGTQDIQGFATRASLQPGQTVSFKVRLAHPEPFRIDIYRLGYYGGTGARKVGSAVLVSSDAHTLAARQPDCDREDEGTEVPTQLVDCGNWAVIARFAIPSNATTGLYFGRATLLTPNSNWRTDDSPKLVRVRIRVRVRNSNPNPNPKGFGLRLGTLILTLTLT